MFGSLFPTRKNPYVPGRDKKEVLVSNLSGTRFSIAVPPTSNGFGSSEHHQQKDVDIYNKNRYLNAAEYSYRRGKPLDQLVFKRIPVMFSGFAASKMLGQITVVGNVRLFEDLPKGMSLFNPKHLEQAIRRYNYFMDGPGGIADMKELPFNWMVVEHGSQSWIYYEAQPSGLEEYVLENEGKVLESWASRRTCRYVLPIGTNQFLILTFHFTGYQPVDLSLKNLHELKDEIFDSVDIKYGNRALSEKKFAQSTWPDEKLSQEKTRENWKAHRFLDESSYEILEHGSPAPNWEL